MKKRLATLTAVVLTAAMLAGCGGSAQEGGADTAQTAEGKTAESAAQEAPAAAGKESGTLRIGSALEWTDMNPYSTYTGGSESQYRNVFEYVFDRKDGELVPLIGKEYKVIDSRTYEVTMYDNVYDSAGNHITADDVVFSYTECKNQFSMYVGFLTDHAEKIDDYTFRVTAASDRKGLVELILSSVPIVSRKAYEASPDKMSSAPVGTGRYVLQKYTPGSSTAYTLNENYWQDEAQTALGSQGNMKNLEYIYITEPAQMTIALETGAVDAIHRLPSTETYHFLDGGDLQGKFDFQEIPYNVMLGLGFNCTEGSPLADQTLRQAVCYAIDTQAISQNAYSGFGGACKTYGSAYCGDYIEAWDSEDYYSYNIEKAKELLAQSGHGEGEVTLRLLTNSSEMPAEMGQIIQACLMQIGINVEILSYDTALYTSYQENLAEWDMSIMTYTCPDYLTSMWDACYSAGRHNGAAYGGYVDEQLQALLAEAISADTSNEETMKAFHDYAKETASNYGLVYCEYFTVSNPNVTIQCNDMGYVIGGACSFQE